MGNSLISRVRQPVKREGSEQYLLITLLSFAASVILTRLFLGITGYPQLGTRQLHIAHVVWGGLLLFVASLLPLILANRWVYTAGALLSGVGVGLFIDEVGKFITQTNDYFYPVAAPIIYAFFLMTVLLYLRVRRPPSQDARAELYRALDALAEVIDHDLEPREWADLEARLRQVARRATHPEMARLANALLDFLASDALELVPDTPRIWERLQKRGRIFEARWINRSRLKMVLIIGLIVSGLPALNILIPLLLLAPASPSLRGEILALLPAAEQLTRIGSLTWILLRLALDGVANLPLLVAAGFLIAGQERRGITVAYVGLLFALTVVNLLIFYFDQFQAIAESMVQFGLLLGTIHYRQRYLGG
ncbi:MAG: hypothetical protein M5U01_18645 [Ardenticatenaceae bacterium]|nr:hypothetical protein [Ardenticatenaceae bacterium]